MEHPRLISKELKRPPPHTQWRTAWSGLSERKHLALERLGAPGSGEVCWGGVGGGDGVGMGWGHPLGDRGGGRQEVSDVEHSGGLGVG